MPKIKEVAPTFVSEILRSRSLGLALGVTGIEQAQIIAETGVGSATGVTAATAVYALFRLALAWWQTRSK